MPENGFTRLLCQLLSAAVERTLPGSFSNSSWGVDLKLLDRLPEGLMLLENHWLKRLADTGPSPKTSSIIWKTQTDICETERETQIGRPKRTRTKMALTFGVFSIVKNESLNVLLGGLCWSNAVNQSVHNSHLVCRLLKLLCNRWNEVYCGYKDGHKFGLLIPLKLLQ